MVSYRSRKCKYTQVRGFDLLRSQPGSVCEGRTWTDRLRILSREQLALKSEDAILFLPRDQCHVN